jgi:hypothetical protein
MAGVVAHDIPGLLVERVAGSFKQKLKVEYPNYKKAKPRLKESKRRRQQCGTRR